MHFDILTFPNLANRSGSFVVVTVVRSPRTVVAVFQGIFQAWALHLIEQKIPAISTKFRHTRSSHCTSAEKKLLRQAKTKENKNKERKSEATQYT